MAVVKVNVTDDDALPAGSVLRDATCDRQSWALEPTQSVEELQVTANPPLVTMMFVSVT